MNAPARALLAACAAVAALLAGSGIALADGGDSASIKSPALFIGQQTTLTITVATAAGATVEVDPTGDAWNGVQVISLGKEADSQSGGQTIHRIDLVVAPFLPGERPFSPVVNIVQGTTITARTLPSVALNVASSLGANPTLALTPLPPPRAIDGAESPLLKPVLALAGLVALALLGGGAVFGWRGWRNLRTRRPAPAIAPLLPPTVAVTETQLDTDPVAAYRQLAGTVRAALARRYGLPASALTSVELRRRLDATGVDRFQGRLVGNLLDECDAVVYAGYRPARERRHADLNMAREIVDGAG